MTTRTTKQESDNIAQRLLADAISGLSNKIDKTENDFIGHLQKVEDRLDQIVELTKTVAVLQSQASQQTDQITEVRTQLRENSHKFDNSVSRIHTRLDEISNHHRDRIELQSKEYDIKLESVRSLATGTEKDLKTWLNRGWGAWVIFVLLVGGINTTMWRWIDNLEAERKLQTQAISELVSYKDRGEYISSQRDTDIASLKEETRKNSTSIRDIEDIVRRMQQTR